jgi:methionine aminotransferase
MSQLAAELRAVNMGQGVPDFEPPLRLRELVAEHLGKRHNQYAPMAGIAPLREAIAAKVERLYGRRVSPADEVTVTCGGTEAIASTIQAFVHPGDEVVVLEPAYDSYEPVVELCGGRVRRVPLERPGFGIDWQALHDAIGQRTRLVILNTPHNPSGACLSHEDLDRLAQLLRPTDAFVLSDEVYEHMVFDGERHTSVHGHPELAARSVVASSFGKTYHATGWKIGYCVAPPALTAEVRKVHQFVTFAIATPLQYAIADFMVERPDWEEEVAAFYEAKRDRLAALFAGSRLRFTPARATYFQLVDYADVSDLPDTEFAMQLLRQHAVATIPVTSFCALASPGERLVRLCFAKDDETLLAAAERLRRL